MGGYGGGSGGRSRAKNAYTKALKKQGVVFSSIDTSGGDGVDNTTTQATGAPPKVVTGNLKKPPSKGMLYNDYNNS